MNESSQTKDYAYPELRPVLAGRRLSPLPARRTRRPALDILLSDPPVHLGLVPHPLPVLRMTAPLPGRGPRPVVEELLPGLNHARLGTRAAHRRARVLRASAPVIVLLPRRTDALRSAARRLGPAAIPLLCLYLFLCRRLGNRWRVALRVVQLDVLRLVSDALMRWEMKDAPGASRAPPPHAT